MNANAQKEYRIAKKMLSKSTFVHIVSFFVYVFRDFCVIQYIHIMNVFMSLELVIFANFNKKEVRL